MLIFFLFILLNTDSQSTRKTTFRCMKPRIQPTCNIKNDFDDSKVSIAT